MDGRKRLIAQPDWSAAACRGVRLKLFFPARGQVALKAREICAGCPIVDACLEYALDAREPAGVWGGKTTEERGLILKRRNTDQRIEAARTLTRERKRILAELTERGRTAEEIARHLQISVHAVYQIRSRAKKSAPREAVNA